MSEAENEAQKQFVRREVLDKLKARGFHASARKGQNFLFDKQLLEAFLDDAKLQKGEKVLEVGAGAGTLSDRILRRDCSLITVEIEAVLCDFLREQFDSPKFNLLEKDALQSKNQVEPELLERLSRWEQYRLIANLPYAIATPLICCLIQSSPGLKGFGVLVQKEAAERFVAQPGSPDYGVASVLLSLAGKGHITRQVSAKLFSPPPRVASAFIVWERNDRPYEELEAAHGLARELFRQRRKMLRKSLASVADLPTDFWERAGISPTSRPEVLKPEDFVRMARLLFSN